MCLWLHEDGSNVWSPLLMRLPYHLAIVRMLGSHPISWLDWTAFRHFNNITMLYLISHIAVSCSTDFLAANHFQGSLRTLSLVLFSLHNIASSYYDVTIWILRLCQPNTGSRNRTSIWWFGVIRDATTLTLHITNILFRIRENEENNNYINGELLHP